MSRIIILLLSLVAFAPTAHAQSADDAARIERIEKDLRVLQRKVFPKGQPIYIEPESATGAPAQAPAKPDTSALVAMQERLDALEARLQTLTGQLEQANFRLMQTEDGVTRFKSDAEFRLNALEGGKAPGVATGPAAPVSPVIAAATDTDAAKPAEPKKSVDAVEAAYLAAYALVEAKDHAKAALALADFVKANGSSRRASYAQYWLGRVYMVEKKFDEAALAFAEGYEKFPKGERAPDTLLWLGKSLVARGQPELACRTLGELDAAYKAIARGRLAKDLTATRKDAKCG
ncbi:MAG: hypothetical protein C0522_12475 [Rhodocyclaceae bacterium]|nr:hypothetical protein [Rhodocyclaceae bacterium]